MHLRSPNGQIKLGPGMGRRVWGLNKYSLESEIQRCRDSGSRQKRPEMPNVPRHGGGFVFGFDDFSEFYVAVSILYLQRDFSKAVHHVKV